jgi:hypothetical protein
MARSKSHPAMRQQGQLEDNWNRHPLRIATPLTCGEYLWLGTRTVRVDPSLVLILVVKILGGGGHVQRAWLSLSIGNDPPQPEDKLTHTHHTKTWIWGTSRLFSLYDGTGE